MPRSSSEAQSAGENGDLCPVLHPGIIPAYPLGLENGLRLDTDRDDVARIFAYGDDMCGEEVETDRNWGICHDNMSSVSVAARKGLHPGEASTRRSHFLFVFSSPFVRCGRTVLNPRSAPSSSRIYCYLLYRRTHSHIDTCLSRRLLRFERYALRCCALCYARHEGFSTLLTPLRLLVLDPEG